MGRFGVEEFGRINDYDLMSRSIESSAQVVTGSRRLSGSFWSDQNAGDGALDEKGHEVVRPHRLGSGDEQFVHRNFPGQRRKRFQFFAPQLPQNAFRAVRMRWNQQFKVKDGRFDGRFGRREQMAVLSGEIHLLVEEFVECGLVLDVSRNGQRPQNGEDDASLQLGPHVRVQRRLLFAQRLGTGVRQTSDQRQEMFDGLDRVISAG